MKNLKKVLSLALAFAMVLGLCIGAMAADTKTQNVTTLKDWADVTNKDAAQLLNAFNIMQGDGNGNFRPADPVTRAEATKMISVALWGGADLSANFTEVGDVFADVKSTDWFAGYVNYAATIGIVAGRNATTFDPQGNVTGYELLKMTLTALGYDQDDEGLVGANWKIRTMALAMGSNGLADLTKDVKVTSWDAPLNRDNTAKVVANMINRTIVKYDRDGYIDETSTKTFGVQYLNLTQIDGKLVANAYGAMNKQGTGATGKYTVGETDKYNSQVAYTPEGKTAEEIIDVNTNSGLYDLGAKVSVFLKDKTPISVAITPATVVTDPYATVESETTITVGNAISPVYTSTTYLDTDGNGKIDLTTIVKYSVFKSVNAVVETKNFGTVYQIGSVAWRDAYEKESSLHTGFESIKFVSSTTAVKDDVIVYAKDNNGCNKPVTVGAVLETVEGTNTRINTANGTRYYYIDGEAYADKVAAGNLDFGAAGVFYTYPGSTDIVTALTKTPDAASVALLYDAGVTASASSTALGATSTGPVLTVAAILPDGTKGVYTVTHVGGTGDENKITKDADINTHFGSNGILNGLNPKEWKTGGINVAKPNTEKNILVEYYLDENGNMMITTACGVNTMAAGTAVKTGTTSVSVNSANKLITPETVTFMQSITNGVEDWTVVVGRNANYNVASTGSVDVVLGAYNNAANTAVKYAVVEVADIDAAAANKSDFIYVIAVNGQVAANKVELVVFDASANAVKTITVAGTTTNIKAGEFYTTYNGSALTDNTTFPGSTNVHKGYVTSFANDILVISQFGNLVEGSYPFAPEGAYVVSNDTKYYILGDAETSAKITADEVSAQAPTTEPTSDTNKPYQAIVITNNNGVATTVILFEKEIPAPAAE